MFESIHEHLRLVAQEDFDREQELGISCPSFLRIVLNNGTMIEGSLMDSLNGIDGQTIDLLPIGRDGPGGNEVWVINTASIAAYHQTFPTEQRIADARKLADR